MKSIVSVSSINVKDYSNPDANWEEFEKMDMAYFATWLMEAAKRGYDIVSDSDSGFIVLHSNTKELDFLVQQIV